TEPLASSKGFSSLFAKVVGSHRIYQACLLHEIIRGIGRKYRVGYFAACLIAVAIFFGLRGT
ncbi:MAG: hypothetical protein WB502_12920, partial [Thermoactinomyces sp.]